MELRFDKYAAANPITSPSKHKGKTVKHNTTQTQTRPEARTYNNQNMHKMLCGDLEQFVATERRE
jgi:hypothetical protein